MADVIERVRGLCEEKDEIVNSIRSIGCIKESMTDITPVELQLLDTIERRLSSRLIEINNNLETIKEIIDLVNGL